MNLYNVLNGQRRLGSAQDDTFFAFTRTSDQNDFYSDLFLPELNWTTSLRLGDGSFFDVEVRDLNVSLDVLVGDAGYDVLKGSNKNDAIFFNNGSASGGVGAVKGIEHFQLGDGDDFIDLSAHGSAGWNYGLDVTIEGDKGNDIIISGAGRDTLRGGKGDDLIFGGVDQDRLYGGGGDDTLYGDDFGYGYMTSADLIYGEDGNDTIYGGAGGDVGAGGAGMDTIYGQAGRDRLLGGLGIDHVYGGDDVDYIYGDEGNDVVSGEGGTDVVEGGWGDDLILGGEGSDRLYGNSEQYPGIPLDYVFNDHDRMYGGAGDDWLFGGEGDDLIYGDEGADLLSGSYGADRFVYKGAAALDGTDLILDFKDGEDLIVFQNLGIDRYEAGRSPGSVFVEDLPTGRVLLTAITSLGGMLTIEMNGDAAAFGAQDFVFG